MLCELNIFYLAFILFVKSSESPSDGDFFGSLLFVWYESLPEPQLLKLLQRPGKDEEVWGVGGMIPSGWLMTMRVCGVWVREMLRSIRDVSGWNSGEGGMCNTGGDSGNVVHRNVGGGLCSSG